MPQEQQNKLNGFFDKPQTFAAIGTGIGVFFQSQPAFMQLGYKVGIIFALAALLPLLEPLTATPKEGQAKYNRLKNEALLFATIALSMLVTCFVVNTFSDESTTPAP